MINKIYNFTDKLSMLLIVTSIGTFNLIIGGNEKALQVLPIGIFTGFSFLLLFIKKVFYKEKLIKSKIDIAVSAFMAILVLPLIFHTYCSLQGTVEFIIKYFFVYCIYLLIRNVIDCPKKVNILIATTVFSSLIIIIFGIDILHGGHLKWLLEKLDLWYGYDYRITSTFGYANAVSIYIAFCAFLAINRIENTKKIIVKFVYGLYVLLGTYIIYISYSRFVLLLYIISLFCYIVVKIYNKLKTNKKLLTIIAIILVSIVLIATLYIIIAMQIPGPYKVKEPVKFNKNFEPDTEYVFTFDMEITSDETDDSNPQLIMYEVNNYFKEIEIARIPLTRTKKIHQVKIKTSSDEINHIKFIILNNYNKKIIINSCYINGEEYYLTYKYLPHTISRIINSFATKDTSIVQRLQFYENCLRIAKDSPIIGHGGNTWKKLSLAYEDDTYAVKETHSYFFELLISYGIIGVIAFVSILVVLILYFLKYKEKRKQDLSIFIGFIILTIYNFVFDFGMSFIVIILAVFMYMAILQNENKEEIKIKYVEYIVLLAIFVVVIIIAGANIAKYIVKDNVAKSNIAYYVADYKFDEIKEERK